MNRQPHTHHNASALLVLCLALAPTALPAQKTLQNDSPFLPPGYSESQKPSKPPPVVAPPGQIARNLELRGIMLIGANYTLSFFDKKTQKSFWIDENESHPDGYSIGQFKKNTRSIPVTKNGQTEEVTLISSSNTSTPINTSTNINTPTTSPPTAKPPTTKPQAKNNNNKARTIPRRRVILPKK